MATKKKQPEPDSFNEALLKKLLKRTWELGARYGRSPEGKEIRNDHINEALKTFNDLTTL